MGHADVVERKYSVAEYFKMEEQSDIRHEYYDGEIFAMADTTMNHNDIVGNVRSFLKDVFRPQGCRIFAENVKLEVIKNFYYPYPDVTVTCDPEDISGTYIVKHPSILVEVLSKSTAAYDRDFKLRRYKEIPTLNYYMLVSQHYCYVELYTRTNQDGIWTYQAFDNPESEISFELMGFTMPVSKIYEVIVFVNEEPSEQ